MMMEFDDEEEDSGSGAAGGGNATAARPGVGGGGGGLRAADTPSKDQGLVSKRAGAGGLLGVSGHLSCRDTPRSGVLEVGCCSRLAAARQTPCLRNG